MWISAVCATTRDHVDVRDQGYHRRPWWRLGSMLWVEAVRVDVWRFVLLRGTMLDPSSVMQPEAMWVPMVCAASGNHVKSMIWAADGCCGKGGFSYSSIDDSRLIIENERHSRLRLQPLPSPTPPKKEKRSSLDRKASKRLLKNCNKNAKV